MVIGMGLKSVKLETAELDVLGDSAIEQGYFELGDGAGNVADRGKFLVVWKQQGGEWRLHRDIWNSSVPIQ
jgi:ketosteroid isomerase-like protein